MTKSPSSPRPVYSVPGLPDLLTPEQVAGYFGVSHVTFRQWMKTRPELVPPYINLGTADRLIARFPIDNIHQHVEMMKQGGLPTKPQEPIQTAPEEVVPYDNNTEVPIVDIEPEGDES